MRNSLLCFCIWLYLANSFLVAQWQFIGSPEIATTYNVAGNRDSLFLCAESGLFFSSDQGSSWNIISTPDTILTYYHVEYSNGELYLVSKGKFDHYQDYNCLYRSSDLGTTWINISPFQEIGTDPRELTVKGDTLLYRTDYKIGISFDKGNSYVQYPVPPDYPNSLVMHGGHLYLGQQNHIIRSGDFGQSWDTIYTMPAGHSATEIIEIDNVLWHLESYFNATEIFIRKSVDRGETWELVKHFNHIDTRFPSMTGEDGHLFVFNKWDCCGILYSPDNGITWQSKENNNRYFLHYIDSILIVTGEHTVKKSLDFGTTFTNAHTGLQAADVLEIIAGDDQLFVETRFRAYQKQHDTLSWKGTSFHQLAIAHNGTIYASTATSVIYYSLDGGHHFEYIPFSIVGGATYTNFFQILTAGNKIFTGGFGEIWYTTDHNTAWQEIMDPDLQDSYFEYLSFQDGKYVAVDINEEIFISIDGIEWDNITHDFPALPNFTGPDATFIYHHEGFTYIFMNDFFGKLADGSQQWQPVERPVLTNVLSQLGYTITSIGSYHSTLIAGVYGFGIFISSDQGDTWVQANDGLHDFQVNTIEIKHDTIYLGVNGGVWKRSLGEFISTSNSKISPITSLSISPMPANEFISISSEDPCLQDQISISLLDLRGQELNSYSTASLSDFVITLEEFPQGIYFIDIRSNSCRSIQKVIKL